MWTPIQTFLQQAGIPPLDLLLDQAIQRYVIQLLLRPDAHRYKAHLVALLASLRRNHLPGTGLRRVADLVQDLYTETSKQESTGNHALPGLSDLEISTNDKKNNSPTTQDLGHNHRRLHPLPVHRRIKDEQQHYSQRLALHQKPNKARPVRGTLPNWRRSRSGRRRGSRNTGRPASTQLEQRTRHRRSPRRR